MGALTDPAELKGDIREGPNATAIRAGVAKGKPCLPEGLALAPVSTQIARKPNGNVPMSAVLGFIVRSPSHH